jgi:hypothetical protein
MGGEAGYRRARLDVLLEQFEYLVGMRDPPPGSTGRATCRLTA